MGTEFPLWSSLYPSQKHLTWLLCSGIIHDRLRLPGAPSHAFGWSRWAALALKSPLGEWSCICVYVCVTGRCPYLLCVSQFCVWRFTSCKLIKPKIKFANLRIIFAVFSSFFTKKSFVLQQEPIREPPSLLISWVNPFPRRFINRTIFFCNALESHECTCCLLLFVYFHSPFPYQRAKSP